MNKIRQAAVVTALTAVGILASKHLGLLPQGNSCLTQAIWESDVAECTALLSQDDLSDQIRADALFRRALISTNNEPEAARSDYHAVLELRPNWTWPLHNLGVIYLDQGDPAKALTLFDRALGIDPTAHHRRTSRAKAYFLLERYQEALADTTSVLEADAEIALTRVIHGRSLAQLGDHDRALIFFSEVLLEAGGDSHIRVERARLFYRYLDLPRHAEIDLRHALKQRPDDQVAFALLGYVLLNGNRYREAKRAFENALAIKPDYSYASRGLTRLQREVSEKQEANTRLSTPLGREIAGLSFGTLLARGFVDLGDTARALVEYDAVLVQEPNNVFAYAGKAEVYQRLGNHPKAIEAFQKFFAAVEMNDESVKELEEVIEQQYAKLGNSYHHLGRDKEALKAWREGLTSARANDVSLWQIRLHAAGHFSGLPDGKISDVLLEGLEACAKDTACLN